MDTNPYQPPVSELHLPKPEFNDVEIVRRTHLNRETFVKFLGISWFVAAIPLLLTAKNPFDQPIFVPFLVLRSFVGIGLWKRKSWTLLPATAVAVFSMWPPSTVIATTFNLYVLYALWSPKGRMLFTPAHKDIIAATPQIKCRHSLATKIIVATLVIFSIVTELNGGRWF